MLLPPTTHREGLLLRISSLRCAPTYNRGVVQHVIFDRFGLLIAQPHECRWQAAKCHANSAVQAASNNIYLYRGRVTAVRRTLQRLHICFRDTIASSSSTNLKPRGNYWMFLILYLRRRYAATAAATAATQSSMPVFTPHEVHV